MPVQLHEELTAADPRRHHHQTPYFGITTSASSSSGLASHQSAAHLALAAPAAHTVMLQDHHVVHPVVNPSIPDFTVRVTVVVALLFKKRFKMFHCALA